MTSPTLQPSSDRTVKPFQILIGCAISAAVALLILLIALYFAGSSFLKFGIGTDLSDYRDMVLEMEIGAQQKEALLADFEELRLSVKEKNRLGLFEWAEIDQSIRAVLEDGVLDERESEFLQADIERLQRVQRLKPARETE